MFHHHGHGGDSGSEASEESLSQEKHTCTDVPCLLVFIVVVIGFAVTFRWATGTGKIGKLNRGIDSEGLVCGISPGVEDRRFLYYCPVSQDGALDKDLSKTSVCIAKCPTKVDGKIQPATLSECDEPHTYAYETKPFVGRFCLPKGTGSSNSARAVRKAARDFWGELIYAIVQVTNAWKVMLMVILAALVLGYAYLLLLREMAACLMWSCVVVSVVALFGGGVYMWLHASEVGEFVQDDASEFDFGGKATWVVRGVAIGLWVLAAATICLVISCGSGLELSIECIQIGTDVMWALPALLVAPILKASLKAYLAMLFFYGFCFLWATGDVSGTTLNRHFTFTETQWGLIIFYIFASFWILVLITAWYQFSIAYAVSQYYFTPPHDEQGNRHAECCGVLEGAWLGLSRHLGSLAFGSGILAVIQLFQRIIEWAQRKNEEGLDNACVSCILNCILCCCRCVEEIVTHINTRAYIDIAITSDTFCQAIRNVMHVVAKYSASIAILHAAVMIFEIIGVLTITACCGVLANFLLVYGGFNEPGFCTVAACVLGFLVAWAFMAVFEMTVDTLLYCYAVDVERHGHAVHSPAELRGVYEQASEEARHHLTASK